MAGGDEVPGEDAARGGDGPELAAGELGDHAHLPVEHVSARLADDLLAGAGVEADGDLVAHGAGGDEDGGFPGEDLGGARFEVVDGWVFGVDVVADLGVRHGLAHGRGGLGEGVAAEIDGGRRGGLQVGGHGREGLLGVAGRYAGDAVRRSWLKSSFESRRPRSVRRMQVPSRGEQALGCRRCRARARGRLARGGRARCRPAGR